MRIVVNKNRIPGDTKTALVTSGLRLGTNSVTVRGMGANEMIVCARLVHRVLSSIEVIDDRHYKLDTAVASEVREEIENICNRFPIPRYQKEEDMLTSLQEPEIRV